MAGGVQENHLNRTDREYIENSVMRYVEPSVVKSSSMDDAGHSEATRSHQPSKEEIYDTDSNLYQDILMYSNIFGNKLDLHTNDYRFGYFNPQGTSTTVKEYLFFTKPDLNILRREDESGYVYTNELNDAIKGQWFWRELKKYRTRIIKQLQLSAEPKDNFNHLLQNTVTSNLEIPSLSAETIETPNNMYGVGFSYRGSSEASDDSFDFSLEFKDTKWLDVYYFFKAYEEYETLKHHGTIKPWRRYIEQKILHDQFCIYKFLVDEDMETILYYCKFYGVMPKSLPREVFSNATFDSGITYSIEFRAAFFEDMRPEIIFDFNKISKEYYDAQPYQIDVYNSVLGHIDNRPAKAAYVEVHKSEKSPNKYVYKLKWRGDNKVYANR